MPRGQKSKKASEQEVHAHLAVRVDRFDVGASAGINPNARDPQYALGDPDDELLYEFHTHLEVVGTVLDSEDRAGDLLQLTVYGESSTTSRLFTRLKDIQMRDEHQAPRYRTYRGRDYPVYSAPKGLGLLDKERGAKCWRATLLATSGSVSDWLALLGSGRELFLAIHEVKSKRQRWLRHVELQTTNPLEE